ncbi:MAG: MFS transporter [Acidimicrobiia bacterium]
MSPTTYPRRSVASLAALVFVAFGVSLYGMSVLLTKDAAGGDFSISLLSAGFGGAAIVAGVLAPRVGRFADDHSVRGLMFVGALLGALAMILFAASTEPWHVMVVFLALLGPATAMTLYEPAFVAIGQWVGSMRRNHAIALLSLIGGLAGPVFLPLTGVLLNEFGWRSTAVILGVIYGLAGVVAVAVFPRSKPIDGRTQPVPTVPWRRFVRERKLLLITIAIVLVFASMNSMIFHRVAVFEEQGFEVQAIAVLAGLSGLLTFPGRYLMPHIAHRLQASVLFAVSGSGLIISLVFAIIGNPAWVMVASFAFFGIAFGFMLPTRPVIMDGLYAGVDFGALMGKQWSIAAVVGGLMPWVVGATRDLTGSYTVPLTLLTLLMVVAIVAMTASTRADGSGEGATDVPSS